MLIQGSPYGALVSHRLVSVVCVSLKSLTSLQELDSFEGLSIVNLYNKKVYVDVVIHTAAYVAYHHFIVETVST